MQIDRYNHLLFPRENSNPSTTGKDAAPGAAVAAAAHAKAQPHAVPSRDVEPAPTGSVVLKIQLPERAAAQAASAGASVYTHGRRDGTAIDPDADVQTNASNHQQAVDRNAGVFTQLTLNKDGVLVAKQRPAAPAPEPDFVALAVSAMREFSDEHDRQKVRTVDANATAPEVPWTSFKGLQQFAAKLNMFA